MLYCILLQSTTATITFRDIVEITLASTGVLLFIWGVFQALSSKANKREVVMKEEYIKDMESINRDFDDYSKDVAEINKRVSAHELMYHSIDKKLDLLVKDVSYIKVNCDKGLCKLKD